MNERTKNVVLITGVSASGKTCLQEELMSRGWKRPINFTTRSARTKEAYDVDEDGDYISNELSEYVFVNKNTFLTKIGNGDFLETVGYGGKLYGVSGTMPEGDVCIILDPSGRAQATAVLRRRGYNVITVYVEIGQASQENRLLERGDSPEEIWKRKSDFDWFLPTPKCIRLNGLEDSSVLADIICRAKGV